MASVHATSPGQLWHQAISAEPLPPRLLVLACCLTALVLVASRRLWPVTRTVVTIAHEGGHALVALAVGRRLEGVRVHRSTAGLTVSEGNASGPGIVATAAAGYLAPPLLGLGTAALLASGHLFAALLLTLVLLACLVFLVRNAYGLLAVFSVAAVVAFVLWRGGPLLQAACWNCSGPGAGAAPRGPTRTSWPGSPGCRPARGSRCSPWRHWARWESARSGWWLDHPSGGLITPSDVLSLGGGCHWWRHT
jgi:hypothetical protein